MGVQGKKKRAGVEESASSKPVLPSRVSPEVEAVERLLSLPKKSKTRNSKKRKFHDVSRPKSKAKCNSKPVPESKADLGPKKNNRKQQTSNRLSKIIARRLRAPPSTSPPVAYKQVHAAARCREGTNSGSSSSRSKYAEIKLDFPNRACFSNVFQDRGSDPLKMELLRGWYAAARSFSVSFKVELDKEILTVDELPLRTRKEYENLLKRCGSERKLVELHALAQTGPDVGEKFSGRSIEKFFTTNKPSAGQGVSYHLDVGDPENPFITDAPLSVSHGPDGEVGSRDKTKNNKHRVILVDVLYEYKMRMLHHNKTYFDCFGRGPLVEHVLEDGRTKLLLSICRMNFFLWATSFRVFDFLKNHAASRTTKSPISRTLRVEK